MKKIKIDYSKYSPKGDPKDTGCPEAQIVLSIKNITKLNDHIQQNKHDYTASKKLQKELSKNKQLLKYLFRTNKERYAKIYSILKKKEYK